MGRATSIALSSLLGAAGCAAEPADGPDGTGASTVSAGTGDGASAADSPDDGGSDAADRSDDAEDTDGVGDTDADDTGGDRPTDDGDTGADASGSDSSGDPGVEVPGGVFLYIGSNGGGPGTDLYPDDVEALLAGAGVDVAMGESLPADFEARFGTLVYLNPRDAFDPAVDAAAMALVASGGRLVLVMEHCKNGCWGNAEGHNALLASLGSSMSMTGEGGAPLNDTPLTIATVDPLTTGVSELVVYYSGEVMTGGATALGAMGSGEVIIGHESIGLGEVVAVADSSLLGYRLDAADNQQFVLNWAVHE